MGKSRWETNPKLGLTIEGGIGDDILSGTKGRDTFILRADSGDDVVTNFNVRTPDYILLDSKTGIYDGYLGDIWGGGLFDGYEIVNSRGTLVATVHAVDLNYDGITDTQFDMGTSSLTLLGVSPSDLTGYSIFGG